MTKQGTYRALQFTAIFGWLGNSCFTLITLRLPFMALQLQPVVLHKHSRAV
jgi:hypothetical protein